MNRARMNPAYILEQLEMLRATQPDIWSDDELREMTIGSETDTEEFLGTLAYHIDLIEKHSESIDKLVSDARTRKERFDTQAKGLRALAMKLMDAAGTRKTITPIATLSIHSGSPKVIITDFALLPERYHRIERKPNKTLIKEMIDQGVPIAGAELSNAEPYLNVRTK